LVTGAQSRDLLSGIVEGADLTKGWLTLQDATIAGVPCKLMRISFCGELGWEVHTSFEDSKVAYEVIRDAGAKPFGMYALNSMRIEKGYRTWKGDLSTDYTLLEGGMERFIRFDKPQNFIGKAALLAEKEAGVKKMFVTMTVDAPFADAPYMSTIWNGDEVVGETTSGDWGFRVNRSIALGVVKAELAVPGTELEVEIFGARCKAVVHADQPLWDPENDRIRA
jgi:dimethylglycine dehydrogenase